MDKLVGSLIGTGKYIINEKMAWGTAGNISALNSDRNIVITASGTFLGALSPDDLVECSINGEVTHGSRKASKELPLHLAVYQERQDVGAVIHATPFHATLIACSEMELKRNLFVESIYYAERIERVAFFPPGSFELAEAVRVKVKGTNIILMENHGVLVCGKDLEEARITLEILENLCWMHIAAKGAGIELQEVGKDEVANFLEKGYYKPKRMWLDA